MAFALLGISVMLPLRLSAAKVDLRVSGGGRGGAIEVGDKFYIEMIVSNTEAVPSKPASVPGAKLIYFGHQSSSSQITTINGHTTQSVTNIFVATLRAEKAGRYSFGPVNVGGIKSNTVSYTIHEPGKGSPARPSSPDTPEPDNGGAHSAGPDPQNGGPTFIGKGNDQLFLRASVSKTTAYEQEALVYTVKLYTTYGSIKFIGATDAPKFDGFVIEESNNISDQLTIETYQGRSYATAVIARYIIFPQMSGNLKIIGNKYTISTDAREYYHDPYFSQLVVSKPIQLNVTPNDLVVNVKPLPTPRPANFSGGVGKFNISSSLKSTNATANQAGSITYSVTGEGNLKYIHLPDMNAVFPDEIEVFTPATDVKTVVGSSNVSGSVKFDYSFMPMEQGSFTIPAVELVYFNPATGKYETSISRSYTLNVARGSDSSKSQATLTYDSKLMPVSLTESRDVCPYIRGFAYWLWYILPGAALVTALILRRKYISLQADVMGLRSRRAGKMARRRLKNASARMRSNDEEGFYDEMLKAIWGYLADKLKLPTSELNRENVSQILSDGGINPDNISKVLALLDECEFTKYSPASSHRKMNEVYEDGVSLLNSLEANFSEVSKKGAVNDEKKDENNDEII